MLQPKAGPPPAKQQVEAHNAKGSHATNTAGHQLAWPKVTSWGALQSSSLRAKAWQGTRGPRNLDKDGPPQTTSLDGQTAEAMHGFAISSVKKNVREPTAAWTLRSSGELRPEGYASRLTGINLKEPMSTWTSGLRRTNRAQGPANTDE